jgi:hypothetical protein
VKYIENHVYTWYNNHMDKSLYLTISKDVAHGRDLNRQRTTLTARSNM